MIKYFCDRCGKEVNMLWATRMARKKTAMEVDIVATFEEKYLLCSQCAKEFDQWMESKK